MKILIFADLHMCPRASIVSRWGQKYPLRLENCIESVNWLEKRAKELNCDLVINLGDFFDKPDLASETITASKEIQWSNIMHYHLVGNHDASISSLEFNSTNSLASAKHKVITKPFKMTRDNFELCFLPYITEVDKKEDFTDYFGAKGTACRVIFSHNDISGIQLGPVISKVGFTIDEIEKNCDLFINGHLHNGKQITNKIVNIGNLTGKDFGEDAELYSHQIAILDTEKLSLTFETNPHAFNFYKFTIEQPEDLQKISKLTQKAVISIKCTTNLAPAVKQTIEENRENIIDSRLIIIDRYKPTEEVSAVDLAVDHLARFVDCCRLNIENTQILEEELTEICK